MQDNVAQISYKVGALDLLMLYNICIICDNLRPRLFIINHFFQKVKGKFITPYGFFAGDKKGDTDPCGVRSLIVDFISQ